MADDQDQDKTEDPTPKKRQEAREEGNVAKSQDLAAVGVLAGAMTLLYLTGNTMWSQLVGTARQSLGPSATGLPTVESVRLACAGALEATTRAMWPLLAGIFVIGVFACLLQTGPLLSTKKLVPNPKTLDPIKGFSKLFFAAKTYVGFGMNLLKLIAVAAVAWWAANASLPDALALQRLEAEEIPAAAGTIVITVSAKVVAVLLLLAILDFMYQRYNHEKELRMTKQQVKDEMKKMEGDPHIKARRRQLARQQSMQRINNDVPNADVVVTNPTHFAVALKYDRDGEAAPRVVAKGTDLIALRIRDVASSNGVAVVERPPLARALFASVEVGREIPEDFYSAVAEILAYVYRLERELAASGAAA